MLELLIVIVGIALIVGLQQLAESIGLTCPHCKMEYKKPIRVGYDYHDDYFCPHCRKELDYRR